MFILFLFFVFFVYFISIPENNHKFSTHFWPLRYIIGQGLPNSHSAKLDWFNRVQVYRKKRRVTNGPCCLECIVACMTLKNAKCSFPVVRYNAVYFHFLYIFVFSRKKNPQVSSTDLDFWNPYLSESVKYVNPNLVQLISHYQYFLTLFIWQLTSK